MTHTKSRFKHVLVGGLVMLAAMTVSRIARAEEEPLIRALTDEMNRSMAELKLPDAERPYFIKYLVNQEVNQSLRAQCGSVTENNTEVANQVMVDLRVGSYGFDNSNCLTGFFDGGMGFANLPTEDDYAAIRKTMWLATDQAYKNAVENLSQKKAILQSLQQSDTIRDLARAEKTVRLDPKATPQLDTVAWKRNLCQLSDIFRRHPQVLSSSVYLSGKTENRYIVNSEGTVTRHGRHVHYLVVEAGGLTKDGLPVFEYDRIVVDELSNLPSLGELQKWVEDFALQTDRMIAADPIDNYVGPVLFTPAASAQMLSELFVDNVSDPRVPLVADSRMRSALPEPRLLKKLGFRVLPDFMSIQDDPTISSYRNLKLAGGYATDDDGVPAQKVDLVENGKLLAYYMSRIPTKRMAESNGHGRLAQGTFGNVAVVGKPGNLIVRSTETTTPEALKAQLLELCRSLGLDYGIMVDALDFSGQAGFTAMDETYAYFGNPFGSRGRGLPGVMRGYRVSVKDGSVTPVCNLDFENVSERALKDILAAGDDLAVSTYFMDLSFQNLFSIVAPSLLVEEMELTKTGAQPKKPPIVPSPLAQP